MNVEQFYATQYTTLPQPLIVPTDPHTFGIDVSRWQGAINWPQCFADGVKFAAIRCTVGDYYTDPNFEYNWQNAVNAGIIVTPYLVVAPADTGRKITAQQHWDRFMYEFGDRSPDLPIVLDCELTRDMTKAYISDLIVELIWKVFYQFGRYPIIYTRQTWFDFNTDARPEFGLCDLWAARYSTVLTGPWSDGKYKFRDWDSWTIWQYSEEGELDGIESAHVDLDWFNGSLEDLLVYADNQETNPPPPVDDDILDRLIIVETKVEAMKSTQDYIVSTLTALEEAMGAFVDWAITTDQRLDDLESGAPPPSDPPPSGDYITVTAIEGVPAFGQSGVNKAGKPIVTINVYNETGDQSLKWNAGDQIKVVPGLADTDGSFSGYEISPAQGVNLHGYPALYVPSKKVRL